GTQIWRTKRLQLRSAKLSKACSEQSTPTKWSCEALCPGPVAKCHELPRRCLALCMRSWQRLPLAKKREFDERSRIELVESPSSAAARNKGPWRRVVVPVGDSKKAGAGLGRRFRP